MDIIFSSAKKKIKSNLLLESAAMHEIGKLVVGFKGCIH